MCGRLTGYIGICTLYWYWKIVANLKVLADKVVAD